MKFKVGDKVRCNNPKYDTLTVFEVEKIVDFQTIRLKGEHGDYSSNFYELAEEKFIYFIEFEEGNHFSKAEFDAPLEDVILNRECLNREYNQQRFTFIKNKEGYWLNYALIKVFRRV